MKLIAILCLCFSISVFPAIADNFSFQIGTNIVEVTFADSSLQVGTKSATCFELQRVFDFAPLPSIIFQDEIEGVVQLKRMPIETYPESISNDTLFMPSLFGISNGFELTDENAACSLFTICVAKDKTTGQIKTYPIGYVTGKWRLFFGL